MFVLQVHVDKMEKPIDKCIQPVKLLSHALFTLCWASFPAIADHPQHQGGGGAPRLCHQLTSIQDGGPAPAYRVYKFPF